jgi:hypothetical protein
MYARSQYRGDQSPRYWLVLLPHDAQGLIFLDLDPFMTKEGHALFVWVLVVCGFDVATSGAAWWHE